MFSLTSRYYVHCKINDTFISFSGNLLLKPNAQVQVNRLELDWNKFANEKNRTGLLNHFHVRQLRQIRACWTSNLAVVAEKESKRHFVLSFFFPLLSNARVIFRLHWDLVLQNAKWTIFYNLFYVSFISFMVNHWPLGVPSCQRTVAFEKACILFNLAAVYTQIATKQDRASEKGLDMAVDNFLRAAGIFKHIHETFTNAPSVDLKPEFLEILVAMMLAQARECLYEKLLLQIETFSIANKSHVSESEKKKRLKILK